MKRMMETLWALCSVDSWLSTRRTLSTGKFIPAFWNGLLSDKENNNCNSVGSVLRGFLALNKKDPVNR